MKSLLCIAIISMTVLPAFWAEAWARTLVVGTCTSIRKPFTSIQLAINAANPAGGDTVAVCPGTYPEQITISSPLTLTGVDSGASSAPVITSPAGGLVPTSGNIAAHVAVINGVNVTISELTIDSAGNGVACGSNIYVFGVGFLAASGSVKGVATRNQISGTPPNTCGTGVGIGIFSGANVTVGNSMLDRFDFGAIYAFGSGTIATIQNNMIMGRGLSSSGYNLISLYDGTTGAVTGNRLIDLDSTPVINSPIGSCGIALQKNASPVTLSNNTIGNTQCGIALYASDANTISWNHIFGNQVSDGVYVCGNGNLVQNNAIASSTVAAVQIDPSCWGLTANNNTVTGNTINETCAGILVNPATTGNVIDPNNILNASITMMTGVSCP